MNDITVLQFGFLGALCCPPDRASIHFHSSKRALEWRPTGIDGPPEFMETVDVHLQNQPAVQE